MAEKIEVEKQKQDETLNLLKTEFYEAQDRYQSGAMAISRILEKRQQTALSRTFTTLEHKGRDKGAAEPGKQYAVSFLLTTLEKQLKNSLSGIFQNIKKASGIKSHADKVNFTLKQKAKILTLAIKEYPHLNLKKAFWKWHFNSRPGEDLIKEAVDKLVLYTNINKDTAAYRLFRIIKEETKAVKVNIGTKRLGLVLFFLTKISAMRRIRSCFDDIKGFMRKGKIDAAKRILEMAALKRKKAFNFWRDVNNKTNRIRTIQSNFIKKMLGTQVGKIFNAIRIMKTLPERKALLDTQRANKFEKGLSKFLSDKLKYTFDQFKRDSEFGGIFKKRAAILMVKMSESKVKQMYGRWSNTAKEARIIEKCKKLNDAFFNLNVIVKANANQAFYDDKEAKLKGAVIDKLFAVWNGNAEAIFRRWREKNGELRMKESLSSQQKEKLLKLLESMLKNNRESRLRDVIERFKKNKAIKEVQKRFLNRLLGSKAGKIKVAFDRIRGLPEPIDV